MKTSMEYTLGEILVAAKLQEETEWAKDAVIHVHLLMRAIEYMRNMDRIYQVQKVTQQIISDRPQPRRKRVTVLDTQARELAQLSRDFDQVTCVLVAE